MPAVTKKCGRRTEQTTLLEMDPNEWSEAQLAFAADQYLKQVLEADNPAVIAETAERGGRDRN